MPIPIPHDTKEVLTFEHSRQVQVGGATEPRLTHKVSVTRRQGKLESVTIEQLGDGYRPTARVDVSGKELDFLVSIFAFISEGGAGNPTPPTI